MTQTASPSSHPNGVAAATSVEEAYAETQPSREIPSCIMTIFGATGDLTRRKLLPAIYDMAEQKLLPPEFAVVGYGRREQDETAFRENLKAGCQEFARHDFSEETWNWLRDRIFYQQGAYDKTESFAALDKRLKELEGQLNTGGNRMFYLATPPDEFDPILENVGRLKGKSSSGNGKGGGWYRVIVEKPFGRDLKSARELNAQIARYFTESEAFRIDHYLGKETVQNILALRFANAIYEPIWNSRYIDHVQIVVAEEVAVGRRAGYYETSGALRDMVVNHMMQLLALVCMEPPVALDANAIRDEKVKVLRAIRPMEKSEVLNNTLRGQYDGYRKEEGVAPDSRTETFVALKLFVDSWRWSGLPIYMRHGKAMTKRATEIAIRFKQTPNVLFNSTRNRVRSNQLILRIQPNEGFAQSVNAKVPGAGQEIRDVLMDFEYQATFGGEPPEAYERLLRDALIGDGTLFTRRDEAEAAWRIADSILSAWDSSSAPRPFAYRPGTWGPEEADDFLARDGRRWREP
jgi:glucose-6-phosphate 1-dehydrogenase